MTEQRDVTALPLDWHLMVTGSREWPSDQWAVIYDALDLILERVPTGRSLVLLHGGAAGPDSWAAEWAQDNRDIGASIETRVFLPDYEKFGNRAPHVRNDEMLVEAEYVAAFWDGKSRGTRSVIDKAIKRDIPWEVHSPAGVWVEILDGTGTKAVKG